MLKVFLVEDEVVVREGIKNNIDWESHGYDFCGEARDGELAYPQIQKLKPDILITDIKMPFMDGLELSNLVKKELPDIEIILLTGYEDFTYAKEAIKIGVAEYLTKPISGEDLVKEIDKVAERIEERNREKYLKEQYMKEMEEKNRMDSTALFKKLVSGNASMSELLSDANELSIDISAVVYNIMLFYSKSESKEAEAYSKTMVKLNNFIRQLCLTEEVLIFERDVDGVAFLFKDDSEEELIKKQDRFISELTEKLKEMPGLRYFGGLGNCVNRMTEIPACFEDAQRAFSHKYFVDDNLIMSSKDYKLVESKHSEEFNISSVDIDHVAKDRIVDFLKTGNADDTEFFIEELTGGSDTNFTESLIFRQYMVMNIYFTAAAFIEDLGYDRSELGTIDFNRDIINSAEESISFIGTLMKKSIELRENSSSKRYKQTIDEVIEYIKDNYADDELSLNSLASHVNVSPNYLSMIFAQQTGVTFIKYLTDYRMNKARELLKCTNKRSSEIAEEIGYRDPHYFSFLFKKLYGITPTQYRTGAE